MQICPSKVDFMHYGPKILPIFLLCYIVQATCTEIALKLRNAKALKPSYVFTCSWTMCVYRCLSYALISTAMNCKHWQTLAL